MSSESSKPIAKVDTFINKIIDKFHPSFKQVRVYGTNQDPLFVANDVYAIIIDKSLDDPYINKKLSTVIDNYIIQETDEFKELIKNYPIESKVRNKDGTNYTRTIKVNMLTRYGVYQMMADLNKYEIAKTFKKFINLVLKELEQEGVAYLEDIQKKHAHQIKFYREELEFARSENQMLINKNEMLENDAEYVHEHRRNDKNVDMNFDQDDYKLGLKLYENIYGFICPIYLINDLWLDKQFAVKLKRNDAEDDDDYDEHEYTIEKYQDSYDYDYAHMTPPVLHDAQTKTIYLQIGNLSRKLKISKYKTKKLWREMKFLNKEHYDKFLERMQTLYAAECLVPHKTPIWHIEYDTMDNVRLDILRTMALASMANPQ
jgi:hypothetical protein